MPDPPADLLMKALWGLTAIAAAAVGNDRVRERAAAQLAPAAARSSAPAAACSDLGISLIKAARRDRSVAAMTIDVRKSLALAAGVFARRGRPGRGDRTPGDRERPRQPARAGLRVCRRALRGRIRPRRQRLHPAERACFGKTGAITKIDKRGHKKRVRGQPAVGRVAQRRRGHRPVRRLRSRSAACSATSPSAWAATRTCAPSTRRPPASASSSACCRPATWRRRRDPAAYEGANNPDADQPTAKVDSNPNSVDASGLHVTGRRRGGNSLIRYGLRGPEHARRDPVQGVPGAGRLADPHAVRADLDRPWPRQRLTRRPATGFPFPTAARACGGSSRARRRPSTPPASPR